MKSGSRLIIYMLTIFALLLVYLQVRRGELQKVREELQTTISLADNLVREHREKGDLLARYGTGADVPAFVEKMHRQARRSGITDDYELSSSRNNQSGRSRGSGGRNTAEGLAVSRMKISLHGEYRHLAEYLRLLQEDGNPKQLLDLRMIQDRGVPRLTLDLELYSFEGKDGA